MPAWAIEDRNGQVLLDCASGSRLGLARKVVPVHYDAFRLQVSSLCRELFKRAVRQALGGGWQIVRIGRTRRACGTAEAADEVSTTRRLTIVPD
jgi:hypothetical protein